jgi:hypothetical protein
MTNVSLMRLSAQLSLHANDPLIDVLTRCTRSSERPSHGLRRIITRYQQMIECTTEPIPELVELLARVMVERHALPLLNMDSYPEKAQVVDAIKSSTMETKIANEIIKAISDMRFVDFARLIESVELMAIAHMTRPTFDKR